MSADRLYMAPPRQDAMLKLVYLMRRHPRLSLAEFQEHLLEHHSQFALRNPAVRRYVQYHTLANDPIREALLQAADGPLVDTYDAVVIAWFDDVEAMRQAMLSDHVATALEDEKRFIDHGRSVAVLTDEQVVVEPTGIAPIVFVECLRRRSDIDRRTFAERWLHHGQTGREAHRRGLLAGYIQNHALAEDDARVAELDDLGTSDENWDGVVTAYFDSIAIAKELFQDPLASETAYEEERTFMDHSKALYLMTRRHPIKDVVR